MIPGASSAATLAFVPSFPRNLSTSTTPRSQRLERIADEFLSLNKLKHYDYSILFRLRLGLNNSAPALSGLNLSVAAQHASTGAKAKAAEKTVSDVKLDKFDAAAKIKVIEEVRSFTELGLKMAKDLVKAPIVVKKGVSKEEALRRINY